MKTILRNERGFTLAIVLMMMVVLLSITGAGLLFSSLNLKASANLKGGTVALQAADAGIQHALAAIPAGGNFSSFWTGTGLTNFPCKDSTGTTTGTCNGTTYKPTLTGSINGYSYSVVVENDTTVSGETATGDVNKIVMLTSTATRPNGSNRKVKAYIGRSTWAPPGTVYLPGASTNISEQFNGNGFLVSGKDTNQWGAVGSGSASPILGIATSVPASTTEVTSTLGSSKYSLVTGLGSNPSVNTATTLDVAQLATDLINSNVSVLNLQADDYSTLDFGTSATNPKIVHIQGDSHVKCGSGNHPTAVGYGVLIVDGNLTTTGLFRWDGIVIVRGTSVSISGGGSGGSTIWGTLLAKQPASSSSMALTIAGSSNVTYSSQAIKLVTDKWPNAFSTNARIIAWNEMM